MWNNLRYLVLFPALALLVYYCLAIFSSWDYFWHKRKSTSTEPERTPLVSILKPVCGVDHGLYENFASMCRLDYPEYEIVFGVRGADDPVVALIEKLQTDFPEKPIKLIVGIEQLGACLISASPVLGSENPATTSRK